MTKKLHVEFGALVPPIDAQLREQNLEIAPKDADRFQSWAQSIVTLYASGIATEAETRCMRNRLLKSIAARVKIILDKQ